MDKYKTMLDFPADNGIIPVLKAIVTAIPPFFPIIIFVLWLLGTGGVYYSILKTTGKKRFWSCLTSMSFICFLLTLVIASMNFINGSVEFISGYWVGFYILMTLISWYMLANYK